MNYREADGLPEWASIAVIRDLYDIPIRQLNRLCKEHAVRTIKWGLARQGARRFSVRDLQAALAALAAGEVPKRVNITPSRGAIGERPPISAIAALNRD